MFDKLDKRKIILKIKIFSKMSNVVSTYDIIHYSNINKKNFFEIVKNNS